MTTAQFIFFAVALVLPTIYQRTKFALSRKSFHNIELRQKSGLQIHHGHWGFLFALIAMFLFVFLDIRDIWTFGLTGLGWGLMLDEIPPMLKMPTPGRDIELDVYAKTQKAAFVIIGSLALISFLLFLKIK